MLEVRVIPCLLINKNRLVKTIKFNNPSYVGDPINVIKIFNDKEVDELVLLDINATKEEYSPNFELLEQIASECFMPLAYGGGIRNIHDIKRIFSLGFEKVIINTQAYENPRLIEEASSQFGSQSIVVSVDIKKNFFGKYSVYTNCGGTNTKFAPVEYARKVENLGAGELFINSIDRDGTMQGYDIPLVKQITSEVQIPVTVCGGAGSINDFSRVVKEGGASAVSAGSMFIYHSKHKAVLISYPSQQEKEKAFK